MEDEMEEELRAHIQHRADDLERSGLPHPEAERRARLEVGGHVRFKEKSRSARRQFYRESDTGRALQLSTVAQISRIRDYRGLNAGIGDRCKCGGFWCFTRDA